MKKYKEYRIECEGEIDYVAGTEVTIKDAREKARTMARKHKQTAIVYRVEGRVAIEYAWKNW